MKNKKRIDFDIENGRLFEVDVPKVKGAKIEYIYDGDHVFIGCMSIWQAMDEPIKAKNKFKSVCRYDDGPTINYGDAVMANSAISLIFNGSSHLRFMHIDSALATLESINTPVAKRFVRTIERTMEKVNTLPATKMPNNANNEDKIRRIKTNRKVSANLKEANQRIRQLEASEHKYEVAQRKSAAEIGELKKRNNHLNNANEKLEDDLEIYKANQSRMGIEIEHWMEKCDQLQAKLAKKSLFSRLFNR